MCCVSAGGRQKARLALASGTKQKTEGFCLSQKTGFCFVGGL
tara:strand:- start:4010 stop:4135 length:126 start_codon:yes stop_codon:yes gene_type:complete